MSCVHPCMGDYHTSKASYLDNKASLLKVSHKFSSSWIAFQLIKHIEYPPTETVPTDQHPCIISGLVLFSFVIMKIYTSHAPSHPTYLFLYCVFLIVYIVKDRVYSRIMVSKHTSRYRWHIKPGQYFVIGSCPRCAALCYQKTLPLCYSRRDILSLL